MCRRPLPSVTERHNHCQPVSKPMSLLTCHAVPIRVAGHFNNSAFTAVAARQTLRFAVTACGVLRTVQHDSRCQVDPNWKSIAEGIVVPFDTTLAYHPEYESYQQGTISFQADAVLMWSLPMRLDEHANATVARNDLMYYEGVTHPGAPSMTWPAFVMGWLFALADEERAAPHFSQSYNMTSKPYGVWHESVDSAGWKGCSNFITGAGSFLQAVIHGYGGVRYTTTGLTITPRLPPTASHLVLDGIKYRGASLRLEVSAGAQSHLALRVASPRGPLALDGRLLVTGVPIILQLGMQVHVALMP